MDAATGTSRVPGSSPLKFGGASTMLQDAVDGATAGARVAADRWIPPGEKPTFSKTAGWVAALLVLGASIEWALKKITPRVTKPLDKAASSKLVRGAKEGAYTVYETTQDGYYWLRGKVRKLLGFKSPAQQTEA